MGSPFTLGDAMREHDKAVYDWLGTLPIDYGNIAGAPRNGFPIVRIFAAPHQAFASTVDLLVHMGWLPGATADEMRATGDDCWPQLPLPVATIERDEPVPDPELATSAPVRRLYLNPTTGLYEYHRWPGHYLTTYRVTFWSLRKATDAFIREWVYSQLGNVGNANYERMLSVVHQPPWGPQLHKFGMDGSLNLDTLEGDTQRYIRTEFSFVLRTLVFFPPTGAYNITHGVGVDTSLIAQGYGVDNADENPVPGTNVPADVPGELTNNLFFFPVTPDQIAANWPVTGAGKASAGLMSPQGAAPGSNDYHSLRVRVAAPGDTVELLERLTTKDGDGRCVLMLSFIYQCRGAPVALEVAQRAAADGDLTSALALALPVARLWKPVHIFVLVKGETVQASIAGGGTAADATFASIDARLVTGGTRIAPAAVVTGGGHTRYDWASLDTTPYLIIVALASGNPPGPVLATAASDRLAPSYSAQQAIDPDLNVGAVFLIQPDSGTLSLSVPSTLALDTVYLQRYAGPYDGSSV